MVNLLILIREDFLHYLWRLKLFNFSNLEASSGEIIQILDVGRLNLDSGPDFFNGKIKIGDQIWAGNIEIHINSSDWYVHNHEVDSAYDSVILHVVWKDDMQIFRKNNTIIPTLILKNHVDLSLIDSYKKLFSKRQNWINCEGEIQYIDSFIFDNWKERLYLGRLQSKADYILLLLEQSNNDWEAVLFKLLSKNFGLKVNSDSFFNMANSFDFSVLRKASYDLLKLESLFFGQAGMLFETIEDVYFKSLKQEYDFLQVKYQLKSIHQSEIKFFRLRPTNFPTIRLSQLANLYYNKTGLFSKLIAITTIDDYYELFSVSTSSYWKTHYSFKSESKSSVKKLTKSFIDLLLVNTIIPLMFVYQQYIGKQDSELILKLIQQIKPEKNNIIDKFESLKIPVKNAFETQALIQLKNEYCTKQKCLQCVIGNEVLKAERL